MTSRIFNLPALLFLSIAVFFGALMPCAGAQAPGAIVGTVTDPNGSALNGAQITIQKPALACGPTLLTNPQF